MTYFFETAETARIIATDAEAIAVAREFAAWLAPGAARRDAEKQVPHAELAALARTGLLGILIPRAHGGAGVSHETVARVFALLASGDPAVGQVPQNHFVFLELLNRLGSDAQKAFFFPRILAGARLGNALSERDSKNSMDFQTRLIADAAGTLRLNGTKYYCTGALTADFVPVFALDAEGRLVVAYVDRHAKGVEITDDWHAMGQRVTFSGTSRFTDVAVPADRVVPLYTSFGRPQISGAFGQILHAAIDVGIARGALEDGARFTKDKARPWFESGVASPAEEQMVAYEFGRLAVKVSAAEELLFHAGRQLDAAEADLTDETAAAASLSVASAKAFGGDVALEVATAIFDGSGTRAADDRVNLHRHWRNARTHTLHDPNRWKYYHIGNVLLNGGRPPSHGLF
jgi:SfnB family sulfur acquisition oxidoreductase